MPADDYTPDDAEVRRAYTVGMRQAFITSAGAHGEEFDRWLARVRAEAGAQAVRDAADEFDRAWPNRLCVDLPPEDYNRAGDHAADTACVWLRARADRIEAGDSDEHH